MTDELLQQYDSQLRTRAETVHALTTTVLGPLWLAVLPGGRGFVTYADLQDANSARIAELVDSAVHHFRQLPGGWNPSTARSSPVSGAARQCRNGGVAVSTERSQRSARGRRWCAARDT